MKIEIVILLEPAEIRTMIGLIGRPAGRRKVALELRPERRSFEAFAIFQPPSNIQSRQLCISSSSSSLVCFPEELIVSPAAAAADHSSGQERARKQLLPSASRPASSGAAALRSHTHCTVRRPRAGRHLAARLGKQLPEAMREEDKCRRE